MEMIRSARCLKKCLFDAGKGLRGRSYSSSAIKKPSTMSLSSMSLSVEDKKYFNFSIPGLAKAQSDESLSLFANMPGVKKEHVEASVDETGSLLSILGKKYDESYRGGKLPKVIYRAFMGLPENVISTRNMINPEMLQDGLFELTLPLPKDKDTGLKRINFITNIYYRLRFNFFLRFYSSIPSAILTLARPFVIDLFCALPFESFTMYKKETPTSLHISVTPGLHTVDPVTEGLCVSLNMPELRLDDVSSFFKHDTLFIQGKTTSKTTKVRYVTGIRLPHFYTRKRSMIKGEMRDGMYKATIPIATQF